MAMVVVKQHKAHTFQKKKQVHIVGFFSKLPSNTKICHQIDGVDQSTINQTIEI